MDMCARTIRLLAAIDQEQDCFLLVHRTLRLRYADNAAGIGAGWSASSSTSNDGEVENFDAQH